MMREAFLGTALLGQCVKSREGSKRGKSDWDHVVQSLLLSLVKISHDGALSKKVTSLHCILGK